MVSGQSFVALAALLLPSVVVAAQYPAPASEYTSIVYKTTTVVRSTCSDHVVPCTLSTNPFTFVYSYPVSTAVAAIPTFQAEYAQRLIPRNASVIVTDVPSTTVLSAGQTVTDNGHTTVLAQPSTITLHITSTITLGLTATSTLVETLSDSSSTAATTSTAPIVSSSSTSSDCSQSYSYTPNPYMGFSSFAPLGNQGPSKTYSSTKYLTITKTLPFPGETDTISQKGAKSTGAPYPDNSATSVPVNSLGTIGSTGPLPTEIPPPFVSNSSPADFKLATTSLLGALLFGIAFRILF